MAKMIAKAMSSRRMTQSIPRCAPSLHSMRTRQQMKVVSAARLKEILEHLKAEKEVLYGKAKSRDTQPAAKLRFRATKAA